MNKLLLAMLANQGLNVEFGYTLRDRTGRVISTAGGRHEVSELIQFAIVLHEASQMQTRTKEEAALEGIKTLGIKPEELNALLSALKFNDLSSFLTEVLKTRMATQKPEGATPA